MRELLGWHPSRTGKAVATASALEIALISRFGILGRVNREFLLRPGNDLTFGGRRCTALVPNAGLLQEVIPPRCPQQNGIIRPLKEQCIHPHRFKIIQHAARAIRDGFQF